METFQCVSIVITTFNEQNYLEKTLDSVRKQDYSGRIEIIVSDSMSTDDTVKIARKYADKVVIKKTNIAQGKNYGARFAKGEIIVFLDADTILSRNWISKAVTNFTRDVDMVVGSFTSQEKNRLAKISSNFWGEIFPSIMKKIGNEIYLGPSTFSIRKKSFRKTGGFSENFYAGEDAIFIIKNRNALKIVFDKNLKCYTSMRRFEKGGYLKWNLIWLILGLPIVFGKRAPFDFLYKKVN